MDKMLDFIDEKILKVQPKNESISFKFYMFLLLPRIPYHICLICCDSVGSKMNGNEYIILGTVLHQYKQKQIARTHTHIRYIDWICFACSVNPCCFCFIGLCL